MMLAYLVRHGVALSRNDPACPPDTERPLTPKGVKKTHASAQGFVALGIKPDAILSSPWLRAMQTAEIFCEVMGISSKKIERADALKGNSPPSALFQLLQEIKARNVVCFGHEPQLHLAIYEVLHTKTGIPELKKAGIACLELERVSPPKGFLVALYPAKTLRLLGK